MEKRLRGRGKDRNGETTGQEVTVVTDCGFAQSGSSGGDEKRLDAEYILKEEPLELPERWCMECERKRGAQANMKVFVE